MNENNRPYVWQMVKEAVEYLGTPITNAEIRDWILQNYPGTNTNTISCQIIVCSVNHTSRIHYPENQKPRICNTQYDFLFKPERGKVELYDPEKHGIWRIIETDDGTLKVSQSEEEPTVDVDHRSCFAAEDHLRDYLAKNLHEIESELQLYTDESTDQHGVEFLTPIGRIDVLALDRDDNYVVIELKVGRGPDSASGQLLRYMNWVKRHLNPKNKVRGIIIAQNISDKIRYALADAENVELKEYELKISLRDVLPVDG